MKYQQLTEGQRVQIALLYDEPFSLSEIGTRTGVHKSTVSRERRRNATHEEYQPAVAQTLSQTRRAGAEKTRMSPDIACFVDMALEWLWSPEQISGVGKRIGKPVSHEGNSRHVSHDRRRGGELYKKRRQGKGRYRRGYGQKRTPLPDAGRSKSGRRWWMNAAAREAGKPTWCWANRARAPSSRWPNGKAVSI